MKPIGLLITGLCYAFAWQLAPVSTRAEEALDSTHRLIFYAVLEGLYEDGVSTEDADQILMRRTGEQYFHFVYACPICTPTIQALEAYRSRPPLLYSLKGNVSTFGSGLAEDLKKKLYSDSVEVRLTVINELVERWVSKRIAALQLTDAEAAHIRQQLEDGRKKGTEMLSQFRKSGTVSSQAPAFATRDECAACNGACERRLNSDRK